MRSDRLASLAIAAIVLLSTTLIAPQAVALLPGYGVLLLLLVWGRYPWRRALALAWRLKWFYLSLVFFFGWLHPDAGGAGWARVVPSAVGLGEAAVRIAALILIVAWVTWLTTVFDRAAQIRGLTRWLDLLRPLGLRGEVFAQRLFLVLDAFEARQLEYRAVRDRFRGQRWGRLQAGREFLIAGLDQALSGVEPPGSGRPGPALAQPVAGGPRTSDPGLAWQVALLWVSVLLAGGLLIAAPLGGG